MRQSTSPLMSLMATAVFSFVCSGPSGPAHAGQAKNEWVKTTEAAAKEGKVVVGIPPSSELRKQIEGVFKSRFPAIDTDLILGIGPANANRIAAERKAGVRSFDILISGTLSPFGLMHAGALESLEPLFLLPEVKGAGNWWGGHIWMDKTKRFVYAFQAYQLRNLWHNSTLVNEEEVRSYDDLLHPKWRGKIGLSDPRIPGSGTALWSFLWKMKGQDFLRRLSEQDLFLTRDMRQIGDALAKGKIAISMGVNYEIYQPFVHAGLPVNPLPTPREGTYVSAG